jgi:hypothetical protein
MKPYISQMNRKVAGGVESSPKNLAISNRQIDFAVTFGQVVSTLAEADVIDATTHDKTMESLSTLFSLGKGGLQLLGFEDEITEKDITTLMRNAHDFYSESMYDAIKNSVAIDIYARLVELKNQTPEPLAAMISQLEGYLTALSASRINRNLGITIRKTENELRMAKESHWAVTFEDFVAFAKSFTADFKDVPLSSQYWRGTRNADMLYEEKLGEYLKHGVLEALVLDDDPDYEGEQAKQILQSTYISEAEVISVLKALLTNTWRSTEVYDSTYQEKMNAVASSMYCTRQETEEFLVKYPVDTVLIPAEEDGLDGIYQVKDGKTFRDAMGVARQISRYHDGKPITFEYEGNYYTSGPDSDIDAFDSIYRRHLASRTKR